VHPILRQVRDHHEDDTLDRRRPGAHRP
jgi:hypothetical protein